MRIPKGAIFIFFMLHFYAWVDVCYKFSFLVHSIYFCSSWFKRSFINQRLGLFTFLPSGKEKRNLNSLSAVKLTKVRCVPVRKRNCCELVAAWNWSLLQKIWLNHETHILFSWDGDEWIFIYLYYALVKLMELFLPNKIMIHNHSTNNALKTYIYAYNFE